MSYERSSADNAEALAEQVCSEMHSILTTDWDRECLKTKIVAAIRSGPQAAPSDGAIYAAVSQRNMTDAEREQLDAAINDQLEERCNGLERENDTWRRIAKILQSQVNEFLAEARRRETKTGAIMTKHSMQQMIASTRHYMGLSLQDVADRAGITKSHLWDLEQGRSVNPTVRTIHGLAEALGLPFASMAEGAINDALRPYESQR